MSEDERHSPEPEKAAAQSGSSTDSSQSSSAAAERRMIRWDALAAIIAACIGLLSLIVAGYTAYIQRHSANVLRNQTQAQVWPHLMLAWSDTGQDILALNKGVGPAIVRSVVVRVDGKPQADWKHVLKALGLAGNTGNFGQSTLNGTVLSPGETLKFFVLQNHAQYLHFSDLARERMDIRACFCSTLGDCWQSFMGRHENNTPRGGQLAGGCQHVPKTDEFND